MVVIYFQKPNDAYRLDSIDCFDAPHIISIKMLLQWLWVITITEQSISETIISLFLWKKTASKRRHSAQKWKNSAMKNVCLCMSGCMITKKAKFTGLWNVFFTSGPVAQFKNFFLAFEWKNSGTSQNCTFFGF